MPPRLIAFARRALHGVSPAFVGICVAFVAFGNLFSYPLAVGPSRGLGLGELGEVFVRMFLAHLVRCVPILIGMCAWNLIPGRVASRAIATAAVIGVTTSLAQLLSHPIDDPVWAAFGDRSVVTFAVWVSDFGFASAAVMVFVLVVRDRDNARALDRERLRVLDLDRGLAQARLRVTQAQIEPHFLFNTLANVRRLYDVDHEGGRVMLRHFRGVLERALPSMRQAESTLGQEIAYATAYLNVQQIRMGCRLGFTFDVAPDLLDAPFPPMMLLTLVENAIKHGLAPLPQGGRLLVEASRTGNTLCVRVVDNGRGFHTSTSGTGIGLANVEARLRAAFGQRSRLLLEENPEGGVTAAIEVPA